MPIQAREPRLEYYCYDCNFAVAIRRLPQTLYSQFQNHLGLLYVATTPDVVDLIELRTHHIAEAKAASPNFLWLRPCLDATNQSVVAARLRTFARNIVANKIPYGFGYDKKSYFDGNFRFHRLKPGEGLSCATFALALLRVLSFEVVDVDSWPIRPEDAGWEQRMLETLRHPDIGASPVHMKALAKQIGKAARLRPEEVAVAVSRFKANSPPIKFPEIDSDSCLLDSLLP